MRHQYIGSLALVLAACAAGTPQGDGDDDGGNTPTIDAEIPDASRGEIDAISLNEDAAAPDAAVPPDAEIPPDACVNVQTTQQLLLNPSVDGNNGACPATAADCPNWVQLPSNATYPPIDNALPTTINEHTAPNAVWLGGILNATDALYQEIAIPPMTAALTFTAYKVIATEDTGTVANDFLRIQIRSTADQVLETVGTYSNVDSNGTWAQFTLPVAGNFAGQTVRLYLQSQTNGTLNTNFFLDTFTLTATINSCP